MINKKETEITKKFLKRQNLCSTYLKPVTTPAGIILEVSIYRCPITYVTVAAQPVF